MEVRRAEQNDVAALRELRLKALRDAPSAFGSTYERELARSPEEWAGWFSPGAVFLLAEAALGAVGLVAGAPDRDVADRVHLLAMWVDPSVRGLGGADLLVESVLDWARDLRAERVVLSVTEGNAPAEHVYARHGFVRTGPPRIRARDGRTEVDLEHPLEHSRHS